MPFTRTRSLEDSLLWCSLSWAKLPSGWRLGEHGGQEESWTSLPWSTDLPWNHPVLVLRQTASENSYSGMPLAFGAHDQSLRILEIPKGTGTMSHQTTHSLLFFSFIYSLLRKISLPLSSAKYKPLGNLHPERSPPSVFLNSHIESQLDLAGDAPGALILNCLWTSVFRRGMVKFSIWHWSACRSRTDVRATLGLTSEGITWIGGCPELWQWLR